MGQLSKMGQKCGTAFKNGSKKCPFKYLDQFLYIWGQAKIWAYSLTSYWDGKLKCPDKREEAVLASRRGQSCFCWSCLSRFLLLLQIYLGYLARFKLANFSLILFLLVHGGWSYWSTWSDSMTTTGPCEKGLVKSFRNCTDPAPQHEGNHCPGSDQKEDSYIEPQCNYIVSLQRADPPVVYKIEPNSLVQCSNVFPSLPNGQSWSTFFTFQSTLILCFGRNGDSSQAVNQCMYINKDMSRWEKFLDFSSRNVMTLARVNAQNILLMGGNNGKGLWFHRQIFCRQLVQEIRADDCRSWSSILVYVIQKS